VIALVKDNVGSARKRMAVLFESANTETMMTMKTPIMMMGSVERLAGIIATVLIKDPAWSVRKKMVESWVNVRTDSEMDLLEVEDLEAVDLEVADLVVEETEVEDLEAADLEVEDLEVVDLEAADLEVEDLGVEDLCAESFV